MSLHESRCIHPSATLQHFIRCSRCYIPWAVEPNAQGCAFAHPIFYPQLAKGWFCAPKFWPLLNNCAPYFEQVPPPLYSVWRWLKLILKLDFRPLPKQLCALTYLSIPCLKLNNCLYITSLVWVVSRFLDVCASGSVTFHWAKNAAK